MKPLLAFDLDGTLIDSARDISEAVNQLLLRYQKGQVDHQVVVDHIGEGLLKLVSDFFPEHMSNPQKLHSLEREFLDLYEELMFNHTAIYPGVVEFLQEWQGPVGIVTNKNEAPAHAILKHLGLDKIPWVAIYGADTLAEKKPSPLPLQTLMQKAQRPPTHTLMIGDGLPDMVSAKRAGVKSIAIGFGYTQPALLQKHDPVAVLENYSDLSKLIKNLGFS